MRRAWWLVPCLVVILALGAVGCAPSSGQGVISITPQQNTGIWVTGQGETMAVPDIAELRLGVEARADTVSEAQTQASEAMHKVMVALKDNSVAEKDIQTQRFSIYPVTKWIKERDEEEVTGYRVTNVVLAKIREVDYESRPLDYRVGLIIDAVAKAGGDFIRIQDISFSVDNPTQYYEEARSKAMEDAKNKANQLADLAGVKLGKASYISEGTVYQPLSLDEFARGGMAPDQASPISPGELKVTVSVQVIYEIS